MSGPFMDGPHKLLRVYEAARAALEGVDIAARCTAAGYAFDPGGTTVEVLGRRFVLQPDRREILPGGGEAVETTVGRADPDRFAERILVLHYLARTSGRPPSGRPVGFEQLGGGRFYGSAFRKRTEQPLAAMFGADPSRLAAAAGLLGGKPGNAGPTSVLLVPFPRVPLTVVAWPGEDEIPASAKVIFDDTAEEHLSTEDIAVLGDLVVRRFREVSAG